MKILLVSTWFTEHGSPPLGLAYIAAYLRENGYSDIEFLDYSVLGEEKLIERVKAAKADLAGIGAMSNTFVFAQKIAEVAKNTLDVPVILGGAHATIMPEQVLSDKNIDVAVIGEGELTILELVRAFEADKPLDGIKGIWFKSAERPKRNEPRPYIENLDILPFPARDLIDMEHYIWQPEEFPMIVPQTGLMAIRGCPFQCTYCQPTAKQMFGLKARARSPKNVVDEMEYLIDKYKLKAIRVGGDTLTADRKWLFGLCNEIKERKIDIPWGAATRVNLVDDEVLKAMKESGCYSIWFGVESGSPRILKEIMNKGITREQTINAFALCRKHSIIAGANIMFGSPTETKEDAELTLDLIRKIEPDCVASYITNPLPGTFLYDYAKEHNLILTENISDLNRHSASTMKRELTDEEVKGYLKKLWAINKKQKLSYYLNPLKKPYYLAVSAKRDASLLPKHAGFLVKDLALGLAMPFALAKYSLTKQ